MADYRMGELVAQDAYGMPPDPRARGYADASLREGAGSGYMASPYPPTERDAQRWYEAQRAYSADQVMRNSPSFRQGVMMPPDPRMRGWR